MPFRRSSVLVVLFMLIAFANISTALTTYTATNVKGSYSVLMNGYSGASSETAWLGILNFDGVSTVSGYVTIIDSGTLFVATIGSGSTYSVSPNGSGSMTLNFASNTGSETGHIAFALNSVSSAIAKNLQLLLIDTSANDAHVRAGTANLINLSGPATAAKLKGSYSLPLNWWTTNTQQGLVGTVTFDGKSKVTVSFTEQLAEQNATTGAGSGTYSVNSDGSGSISLALPNSTTMQLDFVMNSITGTIAKEIQLMDVTSPSSTSVDTGTAVYQ